jgi:preprotein translocase subunit SecA
MGKMLLTQLQRDGLTFEMVATNPHPLFRAIARVAQQSENYAEMATTRLSELEPEAVKEIITEGVALGRDRFAILQVIDRLWIRHLTVLDDLREGIGLRAFGQQDPLVAFRKEASESFSRLLAQIEDQAAHTVFHLQFNIAAPQTAHAARELKTNRVQATTSKKAVSHNGQSKLGRNDPCWCGSGKKYKHCHMRKDSSQTPATAKRQ